MGKSRNVVRVVPNNQGGWKVTQGAQTISSHRKKDTAVQKARNVAKQEQPSQLVVHKKNGQIQGEYTYQDDPHPPDG